MYKVLLVDDEPIITRGLKKLIDWKGLGLEVIGEARDGEEALIQSEELSPDIIITDLLMEGMDGISFIKSLKTADYTCKIIILSGHSEFEYAKEALRQNVFEYLIKPVSPEHLSETMKKAAEAIDEERERLRDRFDLEQRLHESMPILRDKYLWQILEDDNMTESEINEKETLFDLDFEGNRYRVMGGCIENPETAIGFEDDKGQVLLQYGIQNVINEGGKYFVHCHCVFRANQFYIIVVHRESDRANVEKVIAKAIQMKIRDIYGLEVTIGLGQSYDKVRYLSKSYLEVKEILKFKFYTEKGAILSLEDVNIKKYRQLYSRKCESEVLDNVRYNIPLKAEESTSRLITNFISRADNDTKLIKVYCFEFLIRLRNILEVDEKIENPLADIITINEQVQAIVHVEDLKEIVKSALEDSSMAILKAKKAREVDVVAEARDYIDTHYSDSITLGFIADYVHISATYFSALFKNRTGVGFHEYLLNTRMSAAAKHLKSGYYKVYEVAGMVGYRNSRYFSEAFKKYYGVIPTEYV